MSPDGPRVADLPRRVDFEDPAIDGTVPTRARLRLEDERTRLAHILDLLAEDSRLNVYAGELEVRPPAAPTTSADTAVPIGSPSTNCRRPADVQQSDAQSQRGRTSQRRFR
jgi:hypothetical protein